MYQNIKRSPDSAEGVDDILTKDYSQTDTSFPILPDSLQDMEITEVTKETTEKGWEHLLVKMVTTQENIAPGQGVTLNKGFGVRSRIGLTLTEKYTKEAREKAIALLCQAAGVSTLKDLTAFNGKVVQVRVTKAKEQPGFGPSNNFQFVPLKKK